MQRTRPALFAVLGLALAAAGCVTTKEEGLALRRDVDALKDEVVELQRQSADERATQTQQMTEWQTRLGGLESSLSSLRQADADHGVQMEKVIGELQILRGEIEEARYQLGETKKSVQDILERPPVAVAVAAEAPKVDPPPATLIAGESVPEDKQAHYDFAKRLFDDKKHKEALEAFELFTGKHKGSDLQDNVWFWTGESHYNLAKSAEDEKSKEKSYKQAILSYQKVLAEPTSNKGDGALFKIGLAFEALQFIDEAKVFYEEILTKHPKSPLVPEAQKRLKALETPKKKRKPSK